MKQENTGASTLHQQWLESLKKELKTDQPSLERDLGFGLRPSILGHTCVHPQADLRHGQAALSVTWNAHLRSSDVKELMALGVYDFIFDPFFLDWSFEQTNQFLREHASDFQAVRVWVNTFRSDELLSWAKPLLFAQSWVAQGAHTVVELAATLLSLIEWGESVDPRAIGVGVMMETEFFLSISKKRALSRLIDLLLAEWKEPQWRSRISLVARAPWRSMTVLDQHSNILRNTTALAAAYISGCEIVESLPYDFLSPWQKSSAAHSQRLALTTQLVLQQESHLGEVVDAAHGSYSVEEMTEQLAQGAWLLVQKLLRMSGEERNYFLQQESSSHWSRVVQQFEKRQLVQTGVNDFPLVEQKVQLDPRWLKRDHVRLAREFEELRLLATNPPAILLALVGSAAKLQARYNFSKNFFELLGTQLQEVSFSQVGEIHLDQLQADVVVWVSEDELHTQLPRVGRKCFLAGKTSRDGFENIFFGQNVYAELSRLMQWWRSQS